MIQIKETSEISKQAIVTLYRAVKWSAAEKPEILYKALLNSDSLISAWDENKLVGIGNAISDGHLVVYYPHLLIHPDYQGLNIGRRIMDKMLDKYRHFHMQMLTADFQAASFYEKIGFVKAGNTIPMWIYSGNEH